MVAFEKLRLPSGELVEIEKLEALFTLWRGNEVDTYGGKQVIDYRGRPAFAELAVLWGMQEDGWQGVWIDSYRRKLRTGYWDVAPIQKLPERPSSLLERIYAIAGSRAGAWDVFCWRGEEVRFTDCKRRSRDRIQPSQLHFLVSARSVGVPLSCFRIVEWEVDAQPAA
jgi:hypothetical protein